jgi:outer membrane protein assembly factor BamB
MSPLIVTLGGVAQVVSVTQQDVVGVSLENGAVLWKHIWAGGGMGGTMPIAYGDTILVGAGNGLMAFRPSQKDGTWVTETLWQTSDVTFYLSNPVVVGDILFGLSQRDRGQYFAIDAKTGKVLWLGPPRQATNTAVVKADGLLVLLNDNAELIVARASQTAFEPLKRYTVAESATWAQPTLSGQRIFVKDVSSLTLWTVDR